MSTRSLAAIVLMLGCLAAPSRATALEEAHPQAEQQVLPEGTSTFTFADWSGPQFKVWAHVPQGIDPAHAPILIVMHGQRRDADRYIRQWSEVAERCGFVAIAPEFSRDSFPTSREYNLGHLTERGETRLRARERWSFAAIEPLFDAVVARLGGSQQGYTLYGHSAGSQFVHRFLLTQRETRAERVLAANAGWYTLPTFALDFPYGLNGTDLEQADLERALTSDVIVLLGDRDTDPQDDSLNRSEGAMQQGEHRYARGRYFYSFGAEMARRQNWQFGWRARSVPGVAHDNGGIARAAGELVAGVTRCAASEPAA